MNKSIFYFLTFFLCTAIAAFSQKPTSQAKHWVGVKVLAADSSEIEHALTVFESVQSGKRYSLSSFPGVFLSGSDYRVNVSAYGYHEQSFSMQLLRDTNLLVVLTENPVVQRNFTVRAVNVREKSGFVFTRLTQKQISAVNLGQDFTYLLGNTPSSVTTSDAGNGVGYTGIRIRGSDATRISVTVNGIPINDAESHGVYWVNMPDLASSTSSVQVQRGVGSSTIGSGAFGANINIVNTELSMKPFAQFQQSGGSFNTAKSTLMFGTGRLGNFNFGGRLSSIRSDGYLDRASSSLQSFQFNLNYNYGKWDINAVAFGGREKTYQSWYGTPESRIKGDTAEMLAFLDRNAWDFNSSDRENLLSSGRTYNYYTYANQTDNYAQNHFQLHLSRELMPGLMLKSSFFNTLGKGYYEEYKRDAAFAMYGVPDFTTGASDTFRSTDLIRQRWLDNTFYGNFSSIEYRKGDINLIGGASYSNYEGRHFGDVIWAAIAVPFGNHYRYYESKSRKSEFNAFIKGNYRFTPKLQADIELQQRRVTYSSAGSGDKLVQVDFDTAYSFFNPKFAVVYEFNKRSRTYGSYSLAGREPVRTDFVDNAQGKTPLPERMADLELGYIYKSSKAYYQMNLYSMDYKNQLVLTGELNDVGSSLRKNVAVSYRRGVELILQREIVPKLLFDGNLNLSSNKILNFEDVYYNYDSGAYVKDVYQKTDIAFSPGLIAFAGFTDRHLNNTELSLNVKYVGRQYLDNTLNNQASLDPYYTLNFAGHKGFNLKKGGKLIVKAMVNNLTGIFYSNNGYTYKYVYGGQLISERFYYPQSGLNFMIGFDVKFL